jgi:hypothetical protein
MSVNPNILATENPVDRNGALVWNRLHSEREDICEALLKECSLGLKTQTGTSGMSTDYLTRGEDWHVKLLQARLSKIDNALDRLMAGGYGNCSTCGRWIEDTKLDFDPAIAFCIDCWQRIQTQH